MTTVRLKGGPFAGQEVKLPATRVHHASGDGVPEGCVAVYKARHQRPRTLRFEGFWPIPRFAEGEGMHRIAGTNDA
jgi:hypothetical protein